MTTMMLLTIFAISLVCAFIGTRLMTWTILTAAALALFAFTGEVNGLVLALVALPFAAVAAVLNYLPWRRQWLSEPFLAAYRKMTPSLSDTERVALEAGTVGWEGELFAGRPNWKSLLKRRTPELSLEERAFLDGPVEEFCHLLKQWEITHEEADLSEEAWQFLKDNRFFGMIIPKEYGGLGFSALAHRAVLQKVSSISAVAGSTIAVPNSLGPAELLLHYGTEEQKKYYLPRLAKGEEIPCFGLTGPTAGSDATSIPDFGIVCKGEWQGKEVLGMRLTFDKRYITLAPVATVVGLAFRLYDPDGLLGGQEDIGISLALVPHDTPGLDIGRRHMPLNIPFQNGPIRGEDIFVPLDTLIGGAAKAGHGWRMLVESLSVGRAISLPSSGTGGAKLAALTTGAYARIRKQFNMPIGRFEGVEEALARIAGLTYAASALSKMTAVAVDQGERPAVPGAIAKYHATEYSRRVITDAMDVHGGKGVILGPKNYLGRAWQGAPIWITVEGANILTRSMMIFGQGAIRCHPHVLKELEAAGLSDSTERLNRFDKVLFQHIGFTVRNAVRSFILGLSFGRFAAVPNDRETAPYYRKLSRYSAAFALTADITMLTFGGKLKQKESISGRLADALSQLYICSAMLKRFEDQGRPAADQPVLSWAYDDAIWSLQVALRGVIDNFPNRAMAAVLRMLVFPLGYRERRPNDRLTHKTAQLLITPSETRDRLTDGIYKSAAAGHPVGVMEQLLPQVIAVEPLERKLNKALKKGDITGLGFDAVLKQAVEKAVLTEAEAEQLEAVQRQVMDIIAVDEFDAELLKAAHRPRPQALTSNAA